MEGFLDGAAFKVVEQANQSQGKSVRDLAVDVLVYGALAEIFAKETGFHKGLGGSMHAFFLPFGIYPNNAIVGGSADIAVGAALFKKINRQPGVVMPYRRRGDGLRAGLGRPDALGDGPVPAAWDDDMKGGCRSCST
jgi:2-oxoisovalerate dehydrogenase E1 component